MKRKTFAPIWALILFKSKCWLFRGFNGDPSDVPQATPDPLGVLTAVLLGPTVTPSCLRAPPLGSSLQG